MEEAIYTSEEVASKLRVSVATVRRLVKNGELEGFYVGNQIRIPEKALEEFKKKQTPGKQNS